MDREELLTKINGRLGSTKLSLSEKTVNDFLDDALSGITDEAQVTDDFIEKKASFLKSLDGNLHYDVSKQVELYKKSFKPVGTAAEGEPKGGGGGNAEPVEEEWKRKFTELESKIEGMVKQREEERATAERAQLVENAVEALKKKFMAADVGINGYVLRQSVRELNVKGDESVSDITDSLESAYSSALKEAGIEYGSPMGGNSPFASKKAEDAKSRREAMKRELASRGYLPKKDEQ